VTWHGETRHIGIEYIADQSYEELFRDIYADVNDEDGPNMPVIREQYHDILEQILSLKEKYLGSETQIKLDLIALASSGGLVLEETLTLEEIFLQMHNYKLNQHQALINDLQAKI